MRAVYGLVLATVALALVVCVSVNQYEARSEAELLQFVQPAEATMLKTEHYVPPNPFEDPELRPEYDVDATKETAKSKTRFEDARGEIKKAMDIMTPVLKDLTAQDDARDKLMDEAVAISNRIHRVRHLVINIKAEANGIRRHEDTDWVYTNPFGKDADPPAQDLSPFQANIKKLLGKTKSINSDLKALIVKTHSSRNDAIELDSKLYGQIQKAKGISRDAVTSIHHHEDRVEMFNHKDFDVVHRVEAKLNDNFRVDRHRLNGMFNLASDMSARQPNEVSEVTALATDLLIVNAETEERLGRMSDVLDDVTYERGEREEDSSASS